MNPVSIISNAENREINGSVWGPVGVEMMGFQLTLGSSASLGDPGSLLLTEKEAHLLFGEEDPIGITFTTSNQQILTVAALLNIHPLPRISPLQEFYPTKQQQKTRKFL